MAKRQQMSIYLSKEPVDYLREVARYNERSLSHAIDKVLTYAVEKHKAAKTGNQTSLDLLQLLGSAPGATTDSQRDSGLLQRPSLQAEKGTGGA